ncbi:hypothetical protein BUQ74_11880 [Leptospira weilii serovar Heyan]|nr:hypothetical protein BUQ74_11880 [Leptospira weilii serovar Heyan]
MNPQKWIKNFDSLHDPRGVESFLRLLNVQYKTSDSSFFRNYFKKWIEGFTGDCLGFTQQGTELLFYLGMTVSLNFI